MKWMKKIRTYFAAEHIGMPVVSREVVTIAAKRFKTRLAIGTGLEGGDQDWENQSEEKGELHLGTAGVLNPTRWDIYMIGINQ